jgi:hypothetical protein
MNLMKKSFVVFIGIILSLEGLSQSCLPEGIIFTKQSQIDNFQVDYPGCTAISGNIRILGDSSLTNLTGLNVLTSIDGYLEIGGYYETYNVNLTSLIGLENLTFIGGGLGIYDNENLVNLNGLENLTFIGGSVFIGPNSVLTNLTGLENLTYISENLNIINCFALNTLTGLDNLSILGGDLLLGSTTLTSLTGLEGLNSIGGNLEIEWNDSLFNLNGLNNISEIGGYFEIVGNDNLTSLFGLESFTSIGGGFNIFKNNLLINLSGLESLTSIGDTLFILENDSLICLTGIENINAESINGLRIIGNRALSNCEVQSLCDYLTSPNGIIEIYNNAPGCNNPPELAMACGVSISCLPYGNYYFTTQSEVDSFQTNYPNCTELEGDMTIMGIDIKNLYGLNSINSINGDLEFIDNDSLIHLVGLGNLTHIGKELFIWKNTILANFSGIENLTSIGGPLVIYENNSLNSLIGLENIDANSILDLFIWDNPSLSNCDVKSICDYLANPNGDIGINNNAAGCNSQDEVEAACGVGIIDKCSLAGYITIYPNPASNMITIETTELLNQSELTILNVNGRVFDHKKLSEPRTVIDISYLQAGVYFVRLTSHSLMKMFKIVKF